MPMANTFFFISYSRRDQEFVLRLAGDLRAAGSQIWVDKLDLRPGDLWDRAVEAAVRDCVGMLMILSRSSAASDNVADEWTVALDAGKPVIPVRIEPCNLPLRLARRQWIDATGDYADTLRQCRAAMSTELKGISAVPSPAPEAAALSPEVTRTVRNATGAVPRPAPKVAALSPEVKARVSELLTDIMGPIASHLVQKESQGVASLEELVRRLAAHIGEEKDRALFIASVRGTVEGNGKAEVEIGGSRSGWWSFTRNFLVRLGTHS
jgi:hypothetical protein